MENNNKRNKTVTLTVIGIMVLLIVLVGATYAYFSSKSKADAQTINTAKVDLLVEVDEAATHIENIKPTTWYQDNYNEILLDENSNNEDIVKIPIKVTNNSTIDINYDLNLQAKNLKLKEEDESGNKIEGGNLYDIKYKLILPDLFWGNEIVEYGDFTNPDYKHMLLYNQSLKKDQSTNYILFIYIADTEKEQNKLQGITFDVEISANTTKPTTSRAGEKFADAIRKDNETKDREPSYKTYPVYDSSSGFILENTFFLEDKGLFKMQNQNIYYFRGDVKNNYVYFGTLKEDKVGYPIRWRILRINDDDSVTLILDNIYRLYINEFNQYSQYSENESTKYDGSNVKKVLEEWYSKTFSEAEQSIIQETEFCNDTDYDAVLRRLNKDNPEPTLECSNEHKVSANIGLITADEVILSGVLYGKSIVNDYDIGSTWTMTAFQNNSIHTGFASLEVNSGNYTSPVITIKPETKLLDSVTYNGHTQSSQYRNYIIGTEE